MVLLQLLQHLERFRDAIQAAQSDGKAIEDVSIAGMLRGQRASRLVRGREFPPTQLRPKGVQLGREVGRPVCT
jgi:hypothetical protein